MKFEITESPSSQEVEFLTQKINEEATEQGSAYAFAILARNELGEIVAGCNGSIVFGLIKGLFNCLAYNNELSSS